MSYIVLKNNRNIKSKKLYCFYKLAGVLSVSGYIMLQLFTILGQCYFDKGSRADKNIVYIVQVWQQH